VKLQQPQQLKKVFLVHGEETSMNHLSESIQNEGFTVIIPKKGEVFEL